MAELQTLNVEGMTCTNCAASVQRRLEKQGLKDVSVNFATGEVIFTNITSTPIQEISESIEDLGYKVLNDSGSQKKNLS